MKKEPLLRVEVESRTTPDKIYVVTKWKNEPLWRCGCPGFLFHLRKQGLECKHIQAVRDDEEYKKYNRAIFESVFAEARKVTVEPTEKLKEKFVPIRKIIMD